MINLILLSGGSGSRLWPLSNSSRSKQFLKVIEDKNGNHVSMVQRVFDQINKVDTELNITIATSESQKDSILRQISGDYSLTIEPERRNTAAAIMLACQHLSLEEHAKPEDTVIVMPIDSYAEQEFYNNILKIDKHVQSSEYDLVLQGVKPTCPSEKYGYIIPGELHGDVYDVLEFKEKPTESLALEYIEKNGFWNCGIFGFRLSYLLDITKRFFDSSKYLDYVENYSKLPSISFDYEVVEKAKRIGVVIYEGQWKDIGTWNELTGQMKEPHSGKVVYDQETCSNTHVINETNLPFVVAGLQDIIAVATPDGILVSDKKDSVNIKELVNKAAERQPMFEKKVWGEYRVLNAYEDSKGRRTSVVSIIVNKNQNLISSNGEPFKKVCTVLMGKGKAKVSGKNYELIPGTTLSIEKDCPYNITASERLLILEAQFWVL